MADEHVPLDFYEADLNVSSENLDESEKHDSTGGSLKIVSFVS